GPAHRCAAPGGSRRRGQVLRAASGRVRDLCRDGGLDGRVSRGTRAEARLSRIEVAFWVVPVAAFFALPGYLVLGSQILIAALFALSLDLILGYAGILSLGHAAFFGVGAYTAGLLAAHGWGEPLTGLAAGAIVAALAGFAASFLVVRGEDLAR